MVVQPPGGGLQPPQPAAAAQPPNPQPAAAYPAPGQPLQAPGPLMDTYRSFYSSDVNDPYQGQYGAVMNAYHVPLANAGVVTPANLAATVATSAEQGVPMAFLMLCRLAGAPDEDMGKVILLHRVTKYSSRIGLPQTPWDDKFFAFKGEVTNQQVVTVEWEPSFFNQVPNQCRVPTVETANQALAQQPVPTRLGPYADGDAGIQLIRTRRTMYVPPKYVGLFISEDLTPVEAYTRLCGVATADGKLGELAPLLNWLLLALTQQAVDHHSILAREYPKVPLADPTLLNYRWSLLIKDLPGVDQVNRTLPGFHQVATQVGVLAGEIRQGNQDAKQARDKSAAPKTPSEYFGPRLQVLMRLCQVASEDQLPTVYEALSNSKKKQERAVLQHHLDEVCDNLNIFHKILVTPALAKKLSQAEWTMDDDQQLELGIHHFHVTYRNPKDQEALRQLVASYALVTEHESSATLGDARTFLEADKIDIPRSWSQVRYTLQNMWALSSTFLGAAHPNTAQMERTLREYQGMEALLETLPPPHGLKAFHLPAYFVRWMQLRFSVWVDLQSRSPAPVPPPVYSEVFTRIRYNDPWCPQFPPGFLTSPAPPAPSPPIAPGAEQAGRAPPTTPSSDGAPSNARLNNLGWKDIFQPFKSAAVRVRDIKLRCQQGNVDLPKGSDGRTRCLAFHVKGMCNERCGQKADHKAATDAEDQILLQWCQQHWNE